MSGFASKLAEHVDLLAYVRRSDRPSDRVLFRRVFLGWRVDGTKHHHGKNLGGLSKPPELGAAKLIHKSAEQGSRHLCSTAALALDAGGHWAKRHQPLGSFWDLPMPLGPPMGSPGSCYRLPRLPRFGALLVICRTHAVGAEKSS